MLTITLYVVDRNLMWCQEHRAQTTSLSAVMTMMLVTNRFV